jgi:hypothetical protein
MSSCQAIRPLDAHQLLIPDFLLPIGIGICFHKLGLDVIRGMACKFRSYAFAPGAARMSVPPS